MGLSSKQVCSSGLDWKQTLFEAQHLELPKPHIMSKQEQQQTHQHSTTEQCLKCPRCDSTNTKFCYYNNYNKSQPRHFCRACKRHWTKGGTLRNVPVGGGRKNKRVKKSTSTTSTCTPSIAIQTPLAMSDQKTSLAIQPPSLFLQQQNQMNDLEGKDFGVIGNNGSSNGMFTSSTLSVYPQNNSLPFPFSTSASFDTTTCSSSNVYYYGGEEFKTMEEPTINSSIAPNTKPWEIISAAPATSGGGMETNSNYWNWEDIDSLVSTDLKDPWDNSDIKP